MARLPKRAPGEPRNIQGLEGATTSGELDKEPTLISCLLYYGSSVGAMLGTVLRPERRLLGGLFCFQAARSRNTLRIKELRADPKQLKYETVPSYCKYTEHKKGRDLPWNLVQAAVVVASIATAVLGNTSGSW